RHGTGPFSPRGRHIAGQERDRAGQCILHEDHVDRSGQDENHQVKCGGPGESEGEEDFHQRPSFAKATWRGESEYWTWRGVYGSSTAAKRGSPPAQSAHAAAQTSASGTVRFDSLPYQNAHNPHAPIESKVTTAMLINVVTAALDACARSGRSAGR